VLLRVLVSPNVGFGIVLPEELTDLAPDDRYAAEATVVAAFSM
jgi:hypothetical protein